jgi:glutamate-1-semialdehyde 2,1-aminomutase
MAQRTAAGVDELCVRYADEIAARTPRSQELHAEARRVLSGGVSSHFKGWHPFYVAEAKGSRLRDVDGNEYVDLIMGFGPNFLGHSPDVVLDRVVASFASGTSLAIATPLEVELARKIASLVPSMEQMRFVATGTEATMIALRTARAYTGRSKVARFEGHYHGQHDWALVSVAHVAGSLDEPEPVADGAGIPRSVLEETVVLPWDDTDAVARVLRRAAGEVAAVICEPVPFSNLGGAEPNREFMYALRELTRQEGALLIFDEVITGFRIAVGGAAEHFGFAPDLHTFGKTAGGGFPIGVYGGRRDVMEAAVTPKGGDPHGTSTIFQSGTFSGTPPSMAAGLAMLEQVETGEPIRVADERAEALRQGWRELAAELDLAVQVTGVSSWFGVFFTDRAIRTRRDALTGDAARQRAFSLGLLAGGVYLTPSHPGFTSAAHTQADVEHVLAVSERVLRDIRAAGD